MRQRTVVTLAVAAMVLQACSGGRDVRPLRIAATESGGDFSFALEEPVRAVVCVIRDFRRSPTDPAATRIVWAARCTDGPACRASIRYADGALDSTTRPMRLGPSNPGECYECDLTGDHGHGITRFRVLPRGGFEPCSPRVGDL